MRLFSVFLFALFVACSTSPKIPKTDRDGNAPLLTGSLRINEIRGVGPLRSMMNKARAEALFEKDDPRVTNNLAGASQEIFEAALKDAGLLAQSPEDALYGLNILFTDRAVWPGDFRVRARMQAVATMVDLTSDEVIHETVVSFGAEVRRVKLNPAEITGAILSVFKHTLLGTGVKAVDVDPNASGGLDITIYRDEDELVDAVIDDILAMNPDVAKSVSALTSGFAYANEFLAAQLATDLANIDPKAPPAAGAPRVIVVKTN